NAQRHRDAVADLAVGDALTHLDDGAGWIDAEHQRQLHRPRIFAGTHFGIQSAVDRDRVDLEQHLARPGLGCRYLFELQHARRAELTDDNGLQRILPTPKTLTR